MPERSKLPQSLLPHGCMGGMLQFLDFHQRLHIKKILTHKRSSTKSPKMKQQGSSFEGGQCEMKDADLEEEDNDNVTREDNGSTSRSNSGRVLMRSLNSKRRPSEGEISLNHSPVAAKLLRTISIHHLGSQGYVEHGNETPTSIENLHDSDSSEDEEASDPDELRGANTTDHPIKTKKLPDHVLKKHTLLREKLHNAKVAALKQKVVDGKQHEQNGETNQSKELLNMMVLLNNNRELLLKILEDPSSLANFLESQQSSNVGRVLNRSGSSFSNRHNDGTSSVYKHKAHKSELPIRQREDFHAETSSKGSALVTEPFASDEVSIQQQESEIVPCEVKDIGQREKPWNERRASAHFKVIKRKIKDVIKENKKESLRISMDGVLDKIPYGKQLSKGTLDRPATTRYDRESSGSKSMKRSNSLSESMDKYSRLFDNISTGELKKTPERLKLKQEDSGGSSLVRQPTKKLGRIFSLPDFDSGSSRKEGQYDVFDSVPSFKMPMSPELYDLREPRQMATSPYNERRIIGSREQAVQVNEQESCEEFDCSKGLTAEESNYISTHEEQSETWDMKHGYSLDSSIYQQGEQEDIDAYDPLDDTIQVTSELDDYHNFFNVKADPKYEPQFNYIREILWKAGFASEEFLRAWYSLNLPVDPTLFGEAECISHAEAAMNEPEVFLEHQLMFDLINEVLLDIYDNSISCCPWLLRFDTRTRPAPTGHHVLEEAWASVKWHLDGQSEMGRALDHEILDRIVGRDFERGDGWMELQYECEDVALDVDELVLDDLLEEVVLELAGSQCLEFCSTVV